VIRNNREEKPKPTEEKGRRGSRQKESSRLRRINSKIIIRGKMFLARSMSGAGALLRPVSRGENHLFYNSHTKAATLITSFNRFFANGQNLLSSNFRVKDISGKDINEDFFKGKKVRAVI